MAALMSREGTMEIANSMKDLAEHILISHTKRMKALGDLVNDVRKTLGGFAEERKSEGRKQGKYLLNFTNSLSANVEGMLKTCRQNRQAMSDEQVKYLGDFAASLNKDVRSMLKGFYKDHQRMGDEQAKNLGDFVNNLTRDTSRMMNGFRKTHGEMSVELKDTLAANTKNIRRHTRDKLKEFEKAHGRMSATLKKSLGKYADGLARDVGRLLHGYATDMKKAEESWESMSSALSALRMKTAAVSAEVSETVSTVREAIDRVELEQKEAIPEMEVEGRVLEYINMHPEGVKVGSMEMVLGLPRMKLGMKAKKLLVEGRVRKEANLYYPLGVFRNSGLMVPDSGFSRETH
jgi:uncharacterized protein YicC (UPF0701 family)